MIYHNSRQMSCCPLKTSQMQCYIIKFPLFGPCCRLLFDGTKYPSPQVNLNSYRRFQQIQMAISLPWLNDDYDYQRVLKASYHIRMYLHIQSVNSVGTIFLLSPRLSQKQFPQAQSYKRSIVPKHTIILRHYCCIHNLW